MSKEEHKVFEENIKIRNIIDKGKIYLQNDQQRYQINPVSPHVFAVKGHSGTD